MTTVIPALSGGMGSARTVSQPSEAGTSSSFSELLAKAGTEADGGKDMPVTPSVAASDAGEKDVAAESAFAEASADGGDLKADAEQGQDGGENKSGDDNAAPAGEVTTPTSPAVGGKTLPEAATASADQPEQDDILSSRDNRATVVPGKAASQGNNQQAFDRERGRPLTTQPSTSGAQPEASDGQLQSQEKKAVAQAVAADDAPSRSQESEAAARAVAADKASEQKLGRVADQPLSRASQLEAEVKSEPGQPESSKPGRAAGIPLASLNSSPVSEAERASVPPSVSEKAPNIQPGDKTTAPAAADAEPADEAPAVTTNVRQPSVRPQGGGSEQPIPPSSLAGAVNTVPDDQQAADGNGEQDAQPRQDAAVTRQESQRQPATPEWLAQIEHGRRWQQAQPASVDKPAVFNAEASDSELKTAENVAEVEAESTESDDASPRTERLAEAMVSGQGAGVRDTPALQANVPDGQLQLVGISAGREAGATAFERAPVPQGERMLNLHQGTPEQNARQLSQQVQVMVNQELQEADIRLNPSELGGMRIQLKFDQGEVSMHIQAQHAQARDMLEQAMPRLRDMLSQQGIQLGQGQVGSFANQQGSAQNGASGQGATGRENGHNSSPFEQGTGEDEPAYGGYASGSFGNDGRIDFFA